MKRFIQNEHRTQGTLLPVQLDEYISEDNPLRSISDRHIAIVQHDSALVHKHHSVARLLLRAHELRRGHVEIKLDMRTLQRRKGMSRPHARAIPMHMSGEQERRLLTCMQYRQ